MWTSFPRTRLRAASEKKGGRKASVDSMPEIQENFLAVVKDHTAGDPQRPEVVWTYLTPKEIAEGLTKRGTPVCAKTARRLLGVFGFGRRQAQKKRALGVSPNRNAQFENIGYLKADYNDTEDPILSMDAKRKEVLGNFSRKGAVYATGVVETLDHDFLSSAGGVVIPHGLYDVKRNLGHITLGFGHDTSELACDSLELWWRRYGQAAYPLAKSILLLCDGGGSNNSRHHIFKEDLQCLVNRIHLPIRVAHYPSYCSKYNPIEHRFFPHLTRAWQGAVFYTLDLMKRLVHRVHTSTGLKATVAVLKKVYQTKREASDRFLESYPILFDDLLPDWNYTAVPAVY
jgi:hypothetical protein